MVCACHNRVSIPRPPDKPWVVGFSIRNIKKLTIIYFFFFCYFSFDCFTTERTKFDRIFDHHALYQTDDVALVLVVLVGDDDEY